MPSKTASRALLLATDTNWLADVNSMLLTSAHFRPSSRGLATPPHRHSHRHCILAGACRADIQQGLPSVRFPSGTATSAGWSAGRPVRGGGVGAPAPAETASGTPPSSSRVPDPAPAPRSGKKALPGWWVEGPLPPLDFRSTGNRAAGGMVEIPAGARWGERQHEVRGQQWTGGSRTEAAGAQSVAAAGRCAPKLGGNGEHQKGCKERPAVQARWCSACWVGSCGIRLADALLDAQLMPVGSSCRWAAHASDSASTRSASPQPSCCLGQGGDCTSPYAERADIPGPIKAPPRHAPLVPATR